MPKGQTSPCAVSETETLVNNFPACFFFWRREEVREPSGAHLAPLITNIRLCHWWESFLIDSLGRECGATFGWNAWVYLIKKQPTCGELNLVSFPREILSLDWWKQSAVVWFSNSGCGAIKSQGHKWSLRLRVMCESENFDVCAIFCENWRGCV
jgi:hypothetical protein